MAEMHAHPELTPLAAFLHEAIDRSPKTQRQLAEEIGFESAQMISMVKHGATRLPLDKVVAAAIALEVDVAHLLRLTLEQDWPRKLHLLEIVFGLVVSANEKALVTRIRRLSSNADPAFSEAAIDALMKAQKAS